MTSILSLRPTSVARYGAFELRTLAHHYLLIALGISIAIHLGIIGLYFLFAAFDNTEAPLSGNIRMLIHIDAPPPSIAWPVLPGPRIVVPHTRARTFGVPVPVPDPEASRTAEIPTQLEMSQANASTGETTGDVSGTIAMPVTEQEEGPPPPFQAVEKQPVIIHSGIPAYPPLAARADIEGRVIVSIWVDKMGRPKEVRIASTTNDIFNEAALEAARKYLFIPAYMNSGPVSVWVTLAFNFRLR